MIVCHSIGSVKNDSLSVKLQSSQLKVDTISKVFTLVSDTIFLDGTVATPDESGSFDPYEMNGDVIWTVSGNPSVPGASLSASRQQTMPINKPAKWKPTISFSVVASSVLSRNKPGTTSKQESKKSSAGTSGLSWTKTVEICCYEATSCSIKKTCNLPLILTEQTATVTKITDNSSVEAFDGDPVVLVDSKNLRIPDSVGTRGKSSVFYVCVCVYRTGCGSLLNPSAWPYG